MWLAPAGATDQEMSRLANACGQDHHRHAVPLQTALQRVSGLIVQQSAVPGFTLENELAGKHDGLGKIAMDDAAELLKFIDDVSADGQIARRGKAQAASQIDVAFEG